MTEVFAFLILLIVMAFWTVVIVVGLGISLLIPYSLFVFIVKIFRHTG